MVNHNKIFSLKIKRQAKHVFPSNVERTVSIRSNRTVNNVDLDQAPQKAVSGQVLDFWPLIQQSLDKQTGPSLDLFEIQVAYDKKALSYSGKYGIGIYPTTLPLMGPL